MTALADHLLIAPIVLPLVAGALLLLVNERRHAVKGAISIGAAIVLLGVALALVARADTDYVHVYRLGGWPAPFGIVLVADRLSAVLVLLAAVLGVAALVFSLARWDRAGVHFHSFVQFLLAGVNGAFLTGDVFNLFVFFELLLAASYALALHGSGAPRVRAGLHYIVINLVASLLFLVGASLLYGITGTLTMADLAERVPAVAAGDRALVEIGAACLGIAFLVKAGMWPLGFWLPAAYANAGAPAAALFSILSKVGIYAVLRLWLLVFHGSFGTDLLVGGGLATLFFGMLGVLASRELSRVASYCLVVSSGTLLAAIGLGGAAVTGASLYYLIVSTLGIAALFLMVELVERAREPGADVLAVTADAFGLGGEESAGEEVGAVIPAAMALLGLSFGCAALVVAGLPPLPGFVGKLAILAALLGGTNVAPAAWALLVLVLLSGLAAVIALARNGVRIFWGPVTREVPRVRVIELAPVAALLLACLALTVAADPAMRYLQDAARVLHAPEPYVNEVLHLP